MSQRSLVPSAEVNKKVETINDALEAIHTQLKNEPELKDALRFRLSEKTGRRWEKVFNYCGPDVDTLRLLQRNHEAWTIQPHLFVGQTTPRPMLECHPLLVVASECIQLDVEKAWSRMRKRAWCVTYSKLEKRFRQSIATLADILVTAFPYNTADLMKKLEGYSTAGSRYQCWMDDFGVGVIFYLGTEIDEFIWERAAKSGESYQQALDHLHSTNLKAEADRYSAMGDAILNFMWEEVFRRCVSGASTGMVAHKGPVVGGQMWNKSLNTYTSFGCRTTSVDLIEVDAGASW